MRYEEAKQIVDELIDTQLLYESERNLVMNVLMNLEEE